MDVFSPVNIARFPKNTPLTVCPFSISVLRYPDRVRWPHYKGFKCGVPTRNNNYDVIFESASLFAVQRTAMKEQFPFRIANAITITKSQGRTIERVGLMIEKPFGTHGQIYAAASRYGPPYTLLLLLYRDQLKVNQNADIAARRALRVEEDQLQVKSVDLRCLSGLFCMINHQSKFSSCRNICVKSSPIIQCTEMIRMKKGNHFHWLRSISQNVQEIGTM